MGTVLHVVSDLSAHSGGPSFAVRNIVLMLARSPHRCAVAAAVGDPADREIVAEIAASGAQVTTWPRERISHFGYSAGFSRAIGGLVAAADVLHVHSMWNWAAYKSAIEARARRIPVLFRPAGALDRFDVRKHALRKRILGPLCLRPLFRPPNRFHCTTAKESEQLVTYGGDAKREVLGLPVPAVVAEKFVSRAKARREFGFADEDPVLLFISRLNYKKGLDLLLPAVARARLRVPNLRFILAGDGDPDTVRLVDRMSAELGISGWIRRTGFAQGREKAALYAAADGFILPSRNENFAVSLVEAFSAGLPAIVCPGVYLARDLGPSPALAIVPRTERDLEEAVVAWATVPPEQRGPRGEHARRIWHDNFAPEALRPGYEAVYSDLTARRAERHQSC